jgi:hypothetical protein
MRSISMCAFDNVIKYPDENNVSTVKRKSLVPTPKFNYPLINYYDIKLQTRNSKSKMIRNKT